MLLGGAQLAAIVEPDDAASLKSLVEDYYGVYYRERDKQKYRALLTDDYLLLENGEIMTADADIALMPNAEQNYRRTDKFDFRFLKVAGDVAYVVYFLTSDIQERQKPDRHAQWLESIILRRAEGRWRVGILHSTRIADAKPLSSARLSPPHGYKSQTCPRAA